MLIFHRVVAQPDPLFPDEIDACQFDALCSRVGRWFDVLPLDAAVQHLREDRLPARAMAITFDDGYADNHDVALPILRRHGLCATFFVATGFLDGGRMWNDGVIESVRRTSRPVLDLRGLPGAELGAHPLDGARSRRVAVDAIIGGIKYLAPARRAALVEAIAERAGARLPDDLMMRSDQVLGLRRAGMQIGAHTVTHPILARLDRVTAAAEMLESKRFLERLLGEPVTLFAYPNGKPGQDFTPEHVEIAREAGFAAALTTAPGSAHRATDPYKIPRFTPWERTPLRFGARLLANLRA